MIASDVEDGAARATGAEVRDYAGYTLNEPLAMVERQAAALRDVLGGWDGHGATVAVELRFLPTVLTGILHEALLGATLRPVDGLLEPLRVVKTPGRRSRSCARCWRFCDQSQVRRAEC